MKKSLLLLLFMASFIAMSAQTTERKSIMFQERDSIRQSDVVNIENNLTSFYRANRNSHILILGGVAISITDVIMNHDNPDNMGVLTLMGTVCSLVGTVVYLDSFKYLNFNKRKKRSQIRQSEYYF